MVKPASRKLYKLVWLFHYALMKYLVDDMLRIFKVDKEDKVDK